MLGVWHVQSSTDAGSLACTEFEKNKSKLRVIELIHFLYSRLQQMVTKDIAKFLQSHNTTIGISRYVIIKAIVTVFIHLFSFFLYKLQKTTTNLDVSSMNPNCQLTI